MRNKLVTLTTAVVIGAAALAAATSAHAAKWVLVPDGDDDAYAAQRYVESYVYDPGRTYVAEPTYTYVSPPVRRAQPRFAPESGQLYIQTDNVNDGCTYHRERGLFGGWHEERNCP